MELPKQKTPPSTKDPRVLILYGAPKVGKTTELALLPNNLIVDDERGTDFLDALKVGVTNATELEEVALELKKNPYQYDFVTIDTISTLEDWAEEVGTKNYKEGVIGKNFTGRSVLELPNGAGYLYLRNAFQELVGLFSGTTKRLILVAHLREKFLTKESVEVAYKDLELTGKIRSIIASKADAIGYMYREKGLDGKLRVSFQTLETVACGSRCEHLKGQDFEFDWKKIYTEVESLK
jgi:hypothetical protein